MQNQPAFQSTIMSQPSAAQAVKSRFGDLLIEEEKKLLFPRGLIGFPNQSNFALVPFPSEKMKQFRLLQSLDDNTLSFITLPIGPQNSIISANDLIIACHESQITYADVETILMVSVQRGAGPVQLSVNARAPILVDNTRKIGIQHIFQNDSYNVQHRLG